MKNKFIDITNSADLFTVNFLKMICFGAIQAATFFIIISTVSTTYSGIERPGSLSRYTKGIYIVAGLAAIMFIAWWLLAMAPVDSVRRFAERSSFGIAFSFVTVVYCAAVIEYLFWADGIYDDNQIPYRLWYVFIIPTMFTGSLLAFAPANMTEVILPVEKCGLVRYVTASIAVVASVLLFLVSGR